MQFNYIQDIKFGVNPDHIISCPYCLTSVKLDNLAGRAFSDIGSILEDEPKLDGKYLTNFMGIRMCPVCSGICVIFSRGYNIYDAEITQIWPKKERFNYREVLEEDMISDSLDKALFNFEHKHYDVAAMMLRKTIEQICDKEGAPQDKMLGGKISHLKDKLIIPKEIIDGMRDLSYLGNDATHVQSRTFAKVSEEEVSLGIEITIEIIRALYYFRLLSTRLNKLKSSPTP